MTAATRLQWRQDFSHDAFRSADCDEVAKHNTRASCWVMIFCQVYITRGAFLDSRREGGRERNHALQRSAIRSIHQECSRRRLGTVDACTVPVSAPSQPAGGAGAAAAAAHAPRSTRVLAAGADHGGDDAFAVVPAVRAGRGARARQQRVRGGGAGAPRVHAGETRGRRAPGQRRCL